MKPLVDRLRALPPGARAALFDQLGATPGVLTDVRYQFDTFWGRESQIVTPEDVRRAALVVFTGRRGLGKTEAAVQLFNREILAGRAVRPRIFGANEGDVDKAVVHGDSGILATLPPDQRPIWIRGEGPAGVLRYRNGVEVVCFSARSPEGAVSHQGDLDLYDDLAKWGPHTFTAWAHARASCRVGVACGIVATTRRGTVLLRKLLGGDVPGVLIKRSDDIHANRFNLSPKNYRAMVSEFGGTDFHRQEMDDEDVGSSPFTGLVFEAAPIRIDAAPRSDFVELVVAVDPSAGKGGDHDDWGIGAAGRRRDGHVVALDDDSGQHDDDSGGEKVLDICERWGATVIIVEANRGPHVRSAIRAAFYKRRAECGAERLRPMPDIVPVTARDGKKLRAGPLRGLYRQGMLHHVAGLGAMEKQQREWDPDGPKYPRQDDRIDWWVHAVHHLADLGAAAGAPAPSPEDLAAAAKSIAAPFAGGGDIQRLLGRTEWSGGI